MLAMLELHPLNPTGAESLSARLHTCLRTAIAENGGWLPFDRVMALALYEPGLGYYARSSRQFGATPETGSDFVTAPELSPLFGAALARQVAQALQASETDEVFEFGAGSGALAAQLLNALQALGASVRRYNIIDLSGSLREKQAATLAAFGSQVQWLNALPQAMHGVVVGNEVLDAMPVQLLAFDGAQWRERGVVVEGDGFAWADRETALRPPVVSNFEAEFVPGTVTEIHPQAEAFIRTLAAQLQRGAAFFIDYGFPDAEYYLPQRSEGTLMCHRLHQADDKPLLHIGEKDITAHVNFSGVALAGQDAGLDVLGYTSQAHFLMNCGLLELLQGADIRTVANAQKLLTEHEMGELFKVIGFGKNCTLDALGFRVGDRSHTL
jgi:SAM-dependent MidA family methyltransferase